ncbi:hypothetical protein [Hydrogenophaga sp.]|uniref:hypothetical protein n=1 Tax=Hydrogenophaga sp. TaxID=1904254 RepID=UPI002FCCA387
MKIEWDDCYEFVPSVPQPRSNWALSELADELQRLKVDINVTLLGVPDAFPDGGWCIHPEGDLWLVYHSERGRRSRPAIFTSSFDAELQHWTPGCTLHLDGSAYQHYLLDSDTGIATNVTKWPVRQWQSRVLRGPCEWDIAWLGSSAVAKDSFGGLSAAHPPPTTPASRRNV